MKTLPIVVADGFTNLPALDSAIVPPTVNTMSLGALAAAILGNDDSPLCVVVDFSGRKVRAKAAVTGTATAIVATIVAATGHSIIEKFTLNPAESGKVRSWVSVNEPPAVYSDQGADNSSAVTDQLMKGVTQKFSLSGAIGAIEDGFIADPTLYTGDLGCVAIADQGTGILTVVTFDTAAHAAASYSGMSATIGYDQSPAAAAGSALVFE